MEGGRDSSWVHFPTSRAGDGLGVGFAVGWEKQVPHRAFGVVRNDIIGRERFGLGLSKSF